MSSSPIGKKIGLIANIGDISFFTKQNLFDATISDVIRITGGNTGNACHVQALEKILQYNYIQIDWTSDPSFVQERIYHIVVCASNQLGSHSDLSFWANALQRFNLPVTVLSIGAQAESENEFPQLEPGTLDFLKVCQDLNSSTSSNIGVRGEYTHNFLSHLGIDSVVVGCPTHFISNNPKLGLDFHEKHLPERPRITVTAGNPYVSKYAAIEQKLVKLLSRYSGDYVLQHPAEFLEFASASINDKETPESMDIFNFFNSSGLNDKESIRYFMRDRAVWFIDIGHWMQKIKRSELVIGTRYHGVTMAIQSGIPGCVYTIDTRTEELCKFTGTKYLAASIASNLDEHALIEASLWTPEDSLNFHQKRSHALRVLIDFLKSNSIAIPTSLELLLA
jgi:hypothetical protein